MKAEKKLLCCNSPSAAAVCVLVVRSGRKMKVVRENPRRVLLRQYEMLVQNSNNNSGFQAWFDQSNLFKWGVLIDGPPDTPYAGGKFTAVLKFPTSFPYHPPTMNFLIDILHPNVDKNGQVCISILHAPGNDPLGYEKASERWNRNRTVESILVSVQLLLAEPNFDSPANVDAAILFRQDPVRYREELKRRVEKSTTTRGRSSSPPSQQRGTEPPGEQPGMESSRGLNRQQRTNKMNGTSCDCGWMASAQLDESMKNGAHLRPSPTPIIL